jgi:hypothetical protein
MYAYNAVNLTSPIFQKDTKGWITTVGNIRHIIQATSSAPIETGTTLRGTGSSLVVERVHTVLEVLLAAILTVELHHATFILDARSKAASGRVWAKLFSAGAAKARRVEAAALHMSARGRSTQPVGGHTS